MLRIVIKKVDKSKKQMDNVKRDRTLGMNQLEMLEIKNSETEMKNALIGSLGEWTLLRKASPSLIYDNRNVHN